MGWNFEKQQPKQEMGKMEELSDEQCWEYLCATRPEGSVLLNEEKQQDFEKWLAAQ